MRQRIADLLDRIRMPGWPRRIAVAAVLGLVLCIPYPLSITGDFEVISTQATTARNKIDGTVTEVLVKMGDRVQAGQVVARLLDVELKLENEKVAAEVAEVDASLRMARNGFRSEEKAIARARVEALAAEVKHQNANLKRETALFRAKDIPKARLDEARNAQVQARKSYEQARQELNKVRSGFREEEIAQAAAKVAQLNGRLASTKQHLEWTEIKAPCAGIVVTPDHELQALIGKTLPRGTLVLEVVNPDDLVARIAIPESEFGDVELGQEVTLRAFQYPGRAFDGAIDAIEPQVQQTGTSSSVVPVLTKVDKGFGGLRIHTTGRAKVDLGLTPLGYVLYRRFLRSTFVRLWSWY